MPWPVDPSMHESCTSLVPLKVPDRTSCSALSKNVTAQAQPGSGTVRMLDRVPLVATVVPLTSNGGPAAAARSVADSTMTRGSDSAKSQRARRLRRKNVVRIVSSPLGSVGERSGSGSREIQRAGGDHRGPVIAASSAEDRRGERGVLAQTLDRAPA